MACLLPEARAFKALKGRLVFMIAKQHPKQTSSNTRFVYNLFSDNTLQRLLQNACI